MSKRSARKRRRFGYVFTRKWASGRKTWSAQWFDQTQGGKRVTRHFDTENEAHEFLDELERRILAKVYVTPPTVAEAMHLDPVEAAPEVPSFVAYAKTVIDTRLAPVLARGSIGVYRAALRAWQEHFGARPSRPEVPLHEIDRAAWADYRAWRVGARYSLNGSDKPVSPLTLNADQQCAVRILGEAVRRGARARRCMPPAPGGDEGLHLRGP